MNKSVQKKVEAMTEGGHKMGIVLAELLDVAVPGVSLLDIEALAQKRIEEAGGSPSFPSVEGYKWATCLCVNDVIVHGIPTEYVLKEGDLLTIDIGMIYKGYHTDTGWTKIVAADPAKVDPKNAAFLKIGEDTLWAAIDQARVGNRIGHISQAIQGPIEGAGFGIVKTLVGHGVGRELHEPPQIPGYLRGSVQNTLPLTEGMTIAVEVIYTMGKPAICYPNDDGWSIATKDGSLSAVFEHTVAVTASGPNVLTKRSK
jgi:methionyl aminopeptidase